MGMRTDKSWKNALYMSLKYVSEVNHQELSSAFKVRGDQEGKTVYKGSRLFEVQFGTLSRLYNFVFQTKQF